LDPAFVTAAAGLAGAAIGGLTSLASSWINHRFESRDKAAQAARTRREHLYGDFIKEASRLFGDALEHQREDASALVTQYSIVARMRLIASEGVVEAAELVTREIIDTYMGPNKSLKDLRLFARDGRLDPLLQFSLACRREFTS